MFFDNKIISNVDLSFGVSELFNNQCVKRKDICLLVADNSALFLELYVECLRSGHVCMLIDYRTDHKLIRKLIDKYLPFLVLSPYGLFLDSDVEYSTQSFLHYVCCYRKLPIGIDIYDDLAVLLPTSGSTGSCKYVRLSYLNLESNARSICNYLNLGKNSICITNLPVAYSYGLSIINSHLMCGGKIICNTDSIVTSEFWNDFIKYKCNSFSGVPSTYGILSSLRYGLDLSNVRYFTQAGGKMSANMIVDYYQYAIKNRSKFYVMYGQTEATARISYMPKMDMDKVGSVGVAVDGGSISVNDDGEIIYTGDNVMLGYANSRSDCSAGDTQNKKLMTGDLGYFFDGYLYITGRKKNFVKVSGKRLNLDELSSQLSEMFEISVICVGQDDLIFIVLESQNEHRYREIQKRLSQTYFINQSFIKLKVMVRIPYNNFGKTDLAKIKSECLK